MSKLNLEQTILTNLLYSPDYTKKVIPYIKEEYFHDKIEREVFKEIKNFIIQYGNLQTTNAIKISLDKNKLINKRIIKQ